MVALVPFVSTAYAGTYFVRTDDLAHARQLARDEEQGVALPALDGRGVPTYLRYETLLEIGEAPFWSERHRAVAANDWGTGAVVSGALLFSLGVAWMFVPTLDGPSAHDTDSTVLAIGACGIGFGIPLLVAGLASEGPEAAWPSPGMPSEISPPSSPR